MSKNSDVNSYSNITCPFCSIHCDDINVDVCDNNIVVKNEIKLECKTRFEEFNYSAQSNNTPKLKGKNCNYKKASDKCSELIKKSKETVILNSSADVNIVRELIAFISRINGILDHINSDIFLKNMGLFQRKGYISTTLSEIKNKSDVIIVFSDNLLQKYPRLLEKVLVTKYSFSASPSKKKIFVVGRQKNVNKKMNKDINFINFDNKNIPSLLSSFELGRNKTKLSESIFKKLLTAINKSKYLSILWSTSEFMKYENKQKIINNISEFILMRNKTNRAACLSLTGNEGDVSSSQTTGWLTGFPVRIKFTGKYFEYDRDVYRYKSLIDTKNTDLVIHINSFANKKIEINKKIKNIIIGHPLTKYDYEPDVFLPCGVPGIDYQGLIFRTDNVVTLPLSSIRVPFHKSVQEIIREISR